MSIDILTLLSRSVEIGVILLFGCIGEMLMEKAGHLNLGVPGIMCMGAAGGCLGTWIPYMVTSNPVGVVVILCAILFAAIFSAAAGGIYAVLTISLRANQNVTGLALTIFGAGFATFFITQNITSDSTVLGYLTGSGTYFNAYLPFIDSLGWFGKIVLAHGFLAYLSIVLAVGFGLILKRTRVGLNLRAIGESPATADATGIEVSKYKYVSVLLGSAIAGLGGLCYVMQYMSGIVGADISSTIQGIGWLSIALVIFALWRPTLAILGSILFGALQILSKYLTISAIDLPSYKNLIDILPYLVTIIVLIVTSIRKNRENQAPASLGLSYFREDR